jgi:hypothetical protein
MNLKRGASNHPIKIIQNRIIFGQEERGVSYGERDGIINNFAWVSHNGCSLHSFDQVHRGSLIAMHGLAPSNSKMYSERFTRLLGPKRFRVSDLT